MSTIATRSRPRSSISQCRPCLGTLVQIEVSGPADENELLRSSLRAFEEIECIERLMSFHDPASELSRVNRLAATEPQSLSPELAEGLGMALKLSELTDGRFDVSVGSALVRQGVLPDHDHGSTGRADTSTGWRDIHLEGDTIRFKRPMKLDLGGIAKGYAVDRAVATVGPDLEVIVNAGGDLRKRPWQGETVTVRIPSDPPAGFIDLTMQSTAVATSSWYFGAGRHPIMCPESQLPIEDLRSISIFAPNCMVADALTKVAFLMPECETLLAHFDALAVVMDPQGEITEFGPTAGSPTGVR